MIWQRNMFQTKKQDKNKDKDDKRSREKNGDTDQEDTRNI